MALTEVSFTGSVVRATSGATDNQGAASPPLWTTSMRSRTRLRGVECRGTRQMRRVGQSMGGARRHLTEGRRWTIHKAFDPLLRHSIETLH